MPIKVSYHVLLKSTIKSWNLQLKVFFAILQDKLMNREGKMSGMVRAKLHIYTRQQFP